MAQLTLLEASKLMEPSRKQGVVGIYAEAYHPTRVAPVINTGGKSAYKWNVEDDLAHTSGKRNPGADFTASAGDSKPYETEVKIYGGKIQIDEYIVDHSPASVNFQEQSQIKSYARDMCVDTFQGAGGTSLRGFRSWFTDDSAFANQNLATGSTASGDALTEDHLDEIIDAVDIGENTAFYANPMVVRSIKKLSKGSGTQKMQYTKDEFGKWSWSYDGIPVVSLVDGKGTGLLSKTELDAASTNSDTQSLYLISWGIEQAAYISSSVIIGANGVPMPKFTKVNDGTNFLYERFTWYLGLVPHTPRSAARMRNIPD